MSDKPVLVTGAGGFLGGHVVDVLMEHGEQVRALVRPGEGAARLVRAGVDVRYGDLADGSGLPEAVRGVDLVLHMAARTGPWGPHDAYEAVNVKGLQLLIELSLDAGASRFVHVSSITVHGNDVRGTADETSPIRVEPNPYSWSKVAGEQVVQGIIRDRQAPITIVRPGWMYGPRDRASFGRFAEMVSQGKMFVFGPGNNHLPLIYVRDAARGVILAGRVEDAIGQTYILVNDERVTQMQYLGAMARELGAAQPSRHIPYGLGLALGFASETVGKVLRWEQPPLTRYGIQMLGGENRFVIAKARRELGFEPQIGVDEGVRRGIAWLTSSEGASTATAAMRAA